MSRARWFGGNAVLTAAAVILAGSAVVFGTPAPAAMAASPPRMPAAQLTEMFGSYGDAGGHWTGGDSTVSVALPDGRVAWLFADTFLGTVNPDGSRPDDTPMVNNTLVVQDGGSLVDTRHGGTAEAPEALVTAEQPGEFLWVADGLVESGELRVLYHRYHRFGSGSLDVELVGTSLASFALPELTLRSVTDLPLGTAVSWGSALLVDGSYTYVYGASSGLDGVKFGHLARVAAGDLGGDWQFWTGSGWSGTESDAARLLSGVGSAYAVERVGDQYVLVTQEGNVAFDPQFVAYTAPSPTGPFTGPVPLLTAPEQDPDTAKIVYTARLHQDLAAPGKLLFSYDVNSLDSADVYADARLYRPRFVELDWPLPEPDPGTRPAAPDGLTVRADGDGVAHLDWQPVEGATGYRIYRRDVTGGQTHFRRQAEPVTEDQVEVLGLITGHRYEFRVTAENDAGEGPLSTTVAATVRIANDASVVKQSDAADPIPGSYIVRLADTQAVRTRGVAAVAQELVAQVDGTLDRLFPITLRGFAATTTEQHAIDLASHPDVLDVEQDQVVTLDGEQSNPPSWGLDRIDHRSAQPDDWYRFPNPASDVRAYVVDTGVRIDHYTFGGRASYGANTYAPRPPGDPPSTDASDCHGHGTHVAGTLGGGGFPKDPERPDDPGGYGVAKEVEIVAVRVTNCEASASTTSISDGLEWATTHAQDSANARTPAVINLSISVRNTDHRAPAIALAAQNAVDAGLSVVTTAGNEGSDACDRMPAKLDEVITVANVEQAGPEDQRRDRRQPSSGYGRCVDLFAPGTRIWSADHASQGGSVMKSGTSMAAPHVAGAVAMVLQAHPDYTPSQVEQALLGAATRDVVEDPGYASSRLLFVEQPPTSAPGNLVATATPDGTVDLSWDPATGQNLHYLVSQRDLTAGETEFNRTIDPVFSGTTATAESLTDGHTYEFRVAAANSMGTGPFSNLARATVAIAAPGAPTGLTATADADGTIGLAWTAPPANEPLWYWLYSRDVTADPTASFTRSPYPIVNGPSHTAALLTHGHTYEFRVSAIGKGGEGPQSGTARATAHADPPAAPANLQATAGDGRVRLSWDAVADNVYYWIYYRDLTAGDAVFTKAAYPTAATSHELLPLTNGHVFEFKVTAENGGGEGSPSNLVRATPVQPKPGQVTGLTATANPDGTIRLGWDDIGDVYYWIHQRDVTAGEPFTTLELPTEQNAFTTGALTHDHVYEFRISAENLAGEGPRSAARQARATYRVPSAPGNLRGRAAGDGAIELTWDAPADNVYYYIYSRDVTAGEGFTRSEYPTEQTSHTMTMLRHQHVYEFKVVAVNPGGNSPASNTVRVTAYGGLPAPPSGLSASAGNGEVDLTWRPSPSGNVYYWVYSRNVTRGQSFQRSEFPVDGTSATLGWLANGDTYEFFVTAANASGESSRSNLVRARPLPPLPGSPSGLRATSRDGQVALAWDRSPSPNVMYWIYYRDRDAGQGFQRAKYPTLSTSHVLSWLTNGRTYEFKVTAVNLAGESGFSNLASARPMPPLPQAPRDLSARAGNGRVDLSWRPSPTSSVYYWVYYRDVGSWQRLKYPVAGTSQPIYPLVNGRLYEFKVTAVNLSGESPAAGPVVARPKAPPVPPPRDVRVRFVDGEARLSWRPGAGSTAAVYAIYGRNLSAGQPFTRVGQSWSLTGSIRHIDGHALVGGLDYEFYVRAIESGRYSAPSGLARATYRGTTEACRYYKGLICIKVPESRGENSGLHLSYAKDYGPRSWIEFSLKEPGRDWRLVGFQGIAAGRSYESYNWFATPVLAGCYQAGLTVVPLPGPQGVHVRTPCLFK